MVARDDLALAIDLGSSGLKVGLVTLDGRLLGALHAELTTTYGPDGAAAQDAALWWSLISDRARKLTAGVDASRIVAVAITGQYASIVPVDASGVPTAECVMWMDTRGRHHARRVISGPVAGYKPTVAASFLRKTGGAPSTSGADAAGSVLYLVNDRPDVIAASRWLLEPVDYLTMRFSGVPAATHASMFGSWVTDNRDVEVLAYDESLLSTLGFDGSRFAPLVPFGSVTGTVTALAHQETGVPEGAAVITGIPDLHAAAFGAGTTSLQGPGHLALSTTSWISAPAPKKKTDAIHSIVTMPGIEPGRYVILDNHEIGAKALEWFGTALGAPLPLDYDALTSEAATAEPGSGSVIFTPWLAGERSPVENLKARGGFHNLSLATTRPEMIRAVMEGVAYNSRWLAEYVERFAGRPLGPLRLVGGGARSSLWCQIHADVLGQPVEQVADPMVAQLRGVALLAGRTLEAVSADEIDGLVEIAERFEPDGSAHAVYERIYPEFPKLMKSQAGLFKRLQSPR